MSRCYFPFWGGRCVLVATHDDKFEIRSRIFLLPDQTRQKQHQNFNIASSFTRNTLGSGTREEVTVMHW